MEYDLSFLESEQTTEGTPLVDDELTSAPLQATLSESIKENPDQRAKVIDLSKKTGIPVETVAHDVEAVEADHKFYSLDFEAMSKRSPITTAFLTDYDNSAIAHDDVDVLEATEEIFKGLGGTISLRYEDIIAGTRLQQIEERQSIINALPVGNPENLPPEWQELIERNNEERNALSIELLEGIHQRGEQIEDLTPKGLNILQEGIRVSVESLSVMLPALGIGLITRTGTAGVLGSIGVTTLGSSYASGREQGLEPDEAMLYAQLNAASEVGTELLPVKSLVDIFSGAAKSNIGKKVVEFMIREMGTEQLATIAETLIDLGFDLDEQLANATPEEAVAIQARRQAVTAIATIVGGGGQAAIVTGASKLAGNLDDEQRTTLDKSEKEQSSIDDIVDLAERSKLKGRHSPTYKKFKQELAPDDVIYIDGPQAALYLHSVSDKVDVQSDPVLSKISEQIEQATLTNGEVTMSVADFTADVVGSDHFDALRPNITMSTETVSPYRQEVEAESHQSYVKGLIEEAQETVSQYVENQTIFNDATQQMVKSKQISKKQAKYMAQVVPAWATVMSNHTGIPVEDLYRQVGLKIEGPFTEREAALAKGQRELQGVFSQEQDFGDLQFEESHTRAETGESITVSRPAQQVFEQKQKQRTMVQNLLDCING